MLIKLPDTLSIKPCHIYQTETDTPWFINPSQCDFDGALLSSQRHQAHQRQQRVNNTVKRAEFISWSFRSKGRTSGEQLSSWAVGGCRAVCVCVCVWDGAPCCPEATAAAAFNYTSQEEIAEVHSYCVFMSVEQMKMWRCWSLSVSLTRIPLTFIFVTDESADHFHD